jgi:hypothetical protein
MNTSGPILPATPTGPQRRRITPNHQLWDTTRAARAEEAARQAKEAAARQAKEAAERQAKEAAARQAKEAAARQAKEAADALREEESGQYSNGSTDGYINEYGYPHYMGGKRKVLRKTKRSQKNRRSTRRR